MGCKESAFDIIDTSNKINIAKYGFDENRIGKKAKIALSTNIFTRKTYEVLNKRTTLVSLTCEGFIFKVPGGLPQYFRIGDEVNVIYSIGIDIDGNKTGYIHQIYHKKLGRLIIALK